VSEIERLAGDVLCVGLPGDELDSASSKTLRELRPGAIVLFARNVTTLEATRAFVAAACAATGDALRPLVCVDQEGGRVARLRFTERGVPAMLALGATDDEALAERVGARLGRDVAAIGASVDLAPVLDLALVAGSTVIGTRSLGDDPSRVAALGAAIVRGMAMVGVVSVPKHFPGHGATSVDSHVAMPTIATPAAVVVSRDCAPFATAFAAGARAVMTAHAIVADFDPDLPATMSPRIITGLLREELGFDGVCFTDCLQMDAIATTVGAARGAVLAIAAGADSCIISHDLELARDAREAIVAAVGDGTLALDRLREAASRVRALRESCALAANSLPLERGDLDDVPALVAARAIHVVRGDVRLDLTRPVTVVSFEDDAGDGVAANGGTRPSLSLALRHRRVRSELLRVPRDPDPAMRAMLLDVLAGQGSRALVIVARRAHLFAAQRDTIAELLAAAPHAIVISALEPFDVPSFGDARVVACSFDDGEAAMEALADVLTSRAIATGRMPVTLAAS
jgi:beta-N-acetylhexosaminidase